MKYVKKVLAVIGISLLPIVGFSNDVTRTIEKGDVLINPGITLGWYNYGYNLDVVNILPPVFLNFEIATHDYFSFGLEADYGVRRYRDFLFTQYSSEWKYTYRALGVRGSFHYLDFLKNLMDEDIFGINNVDLDLYAGASTGLFSITTEEKYTDPGTGQDRETKSFSSSWYFGYMLGARYYFTKNLGAFIEGGRNTLGWAKVGLTLKF